MIPCCHSNMRQKFEFGSNKGWLMFEGAFASSLFQRLTVHGPATKSILNVGVCHHMKNHLGSGLENVLTQRLVIFKPQGLPRFSLLQRSCWNTVLQSMLCMRSLCTFLHVAMLSSSILVSPVSPILFLHSSQGSMDNICPAFQWEILQKHVCVSGMSKASEWIKYVRILLYIIVRHVHFASLSNFANWKQQIHRPRLGLPLMIPSSTSHACNSELTWNVPDSPVIHEAVWTRPYKLESPPLQVVGAVASAKQDAHTKAYKYTQCVYT